MVNEPQTDKSVLVVDSELSTWEHCNRLLAPRGYRVEAATTGLEGADKVGKGEFGLVLLDAMVPDIDGIELLRHLRMLDPKAVCVVLSACATVDLAVAAMKLGAHDFLQKPCSDDRLLAAVESGVHQRHLQKQPIQRQNWSEASMSFIHEESAKLLQEKARLLQLEEANSAYLRKVAHELRAPIAAIRSILTLILKGYTTPQQAREMQERAAARADELLMLSSDILDLARLKDKHFGSTPQCICVEDILKDVLDLHAAEAQAKGIRIRTDVRPCGTVIADPTHIKHLWTNLISNAIKYSSKGGQVTVRLFPEHGMIVGVVKDNGIGIAKEDLPHLFEEFFRTEQAKAFTRMGTGLGLSIVKQILEQYNGDIRVESELNKGTQFTFWLPTGSAHARDAHAPMN